MDLRNSKIGERHKITFSKASDFWVRSKVRKVKKKGNKKAHSAFLT